MTKAFVFGKFLPFHKGHEALIGFALTKCDHLSVLVCCSDKEVINAEKRKSWIEDCFKSVPNLDVQVLNYKESELPNTSESSKEVSKVWAKCFKELLPDYNLLVTSEPYGDYVAEFMNIQHILFDQERQCVPISASAIRINTCENWKYLSDIVKSFFSMKVVILGTESTGKSTLAEDLSRHYKCSLVTEVGRELIPDSKDFEYEDLMLVAREHAKKIEEAARGDHPLIIVDTDIHITMSYSRFVFNKDLKVHDSVVASNKAQLYLYLNNDVDHIQDGTRLNLDNRNYLDRSHRKILEENNIQFIEIKGNWSERFNTAVKCINELLTANPVGNYSSLLY